MAAFTTVVDDPDAVNQEINKLITSTHSTSMHVTRRKSTGATLLPGVEVAPQLVKKHGAPVALKAPQQVQQQQQQQQQLLQQQMAQQQQHFLQQQQYQQQLYHQQQMQQQPQQQYLQQPQQQYLQQPQYLQQGAMYSLPQQVQVLPQYAPMPLMQPAQPASPSHKRSFDEMSAPQPPQTQTLYLAPAQYATAQYGVPQPLFMPNPVQLPYTGPAPPPPLTLSSLGADESLDYEPPTKKQKPDDQGL